MKNAIKLLLTLPLIFTLIAPPGLLGGRNTLSPRSLFQTENQQRRQAIQSYLENGLLNIDQVTQAHFNFLHSRKKQEERKKSLSSGDQLVAMVRTDNLDEATKLAMQQPQDQGAFADYLRLAQRISSEEATNEFISKYLNYYLAVRNSNNPFDLKDLHHAISPEDLRQYIKDNIESKDLKYLQLEFLFAEMIRRLKLGKNYAGHTWPKDKTSPLHKKNILNDIKNLLTSIQSIPAVKKEKIVQSHRLKIFILLHLYPVVIDNDRSSYHAITGDWDLADLRWVNLTGEVSFFGGRSFKKTDLRHSRLEIAPHSAKFDHASLANARLKNFKLVGDPDNWPDSSRTEFNSVDLTNIDLTRAYFKNIDFSNIDFTSARLNATRFDFDTVSFKECKWSKKQALYFPAIAPLFLLTSLNSNLLAVAAMLGFFYAVVKLATSIRAKEKLQNKLSQQQWFTVRENVFGGRISLNPLPFDVSL